MAPAARAISSSLAAGSNGCSVPGTTGTPARMATARAPVLLPMSRDCFGRRADERQAGIAAGTREGRVLGQEPVAGMHRIGARSARDVEDRLDVEIAAGGLVRPEVEGLMCLAHVPRGAVAVGIDGDGRQPHFAARANDPDGDLAAVGDEDFH